MAKPTKQLRNVIETATSELVEAILTFAEQKIPARGRTKLEGEIFANRDGEVSVRVGVRAPVVVSGTPVDASVSVEPGKETEAEMRAKWTFELEAESAGE